MNFSYNEAETNPSVSLPQFSELTSRPNQMVASTQYTTNGNVQSQAVQTTVYTTASNSSQKQLLVNSPIRYTSPILSWPDTNTLMQLCERQGIQTINIPNYNQNSGILNAQSTNLPTNVTPTILVSSTSQTEIKQEMDVASGEQKSFEDIQTQLQQSAAVAEYLQKLQATTLPLTLQQIIKLQAEQIKREKAEEKLEHTQNNILNIPSVSMLRNNQLQNGGSFINSEQMMIINPNDLNVHLENEQENESGMQPVIKVEQQVQTDSPKIEKKSKFRAKVGEIKISVTVDGSTFYCCPECNMAYPNRPEVEQHIQAHIQERKYQCKECGAMLKRKEHLDQHMRGHSDERPFKCPLCHKAFKRNEHLTRHYVIHSGDKNFLCNVCQKAFSRKDHLNKHTQTHSSMRKNKMKKESYLVEPKDSFDKSIDASSMLKEEVNCMFKDNCMLKQENSFLQHIQNLQKDSNLLHTLSSFKEQAMKDVNVLQQQSVNMNEILPQNTRYLMPS